MQQADVVRHLQPSAKLMPTGAVEFQDSVRTRGNELADRGQMQVHRISVGVGQNQGCAIPRAGQTAPKMYAQS